MRKDFRPDSSVQDATGIWSTTGPANLSRYAFLLLLGLFLFEVVMLPHDFGHYTDTLEQEGLVGFLCLPSLLGMQICILFGVLILLISSFRRRLRRAVRVMFLILSVSFGVYALSLFLIYRASMHGEFAIGAASLAVLFGFIPSGVLLLIGVPFAFIYAIRKPYA